MKPSQYNLFIPSSKQGDFILYNTLRGSVFVVDNNARVAIESADNKAIDEAYLQTLSKKGILVDDDLDEKLIFKINRDRAKYSSRSLSLVILSTFKCNLTCTYCFVPRGGWEKLDTAISDKSALKYREREEQRK